MAAVALSMGVSPAAPFHELESAKVGSPPKLDGSGKDDAWKNAKEIVVEAVDGPEISVRSVHTDNEIFFLFTWEDESASNNQDMWVYDGSKWGIKQEVRYEGEEAWEASSDRLALQWVINESIPGFEEKGCRKICHAPEKEDKMYTDGPVQRTDIWHWTSSTTNPAGFAYDQYLDNKNLPKAKEPNQELRISVAHHDDGVVSRNLENQRNKSSDKPKWMPSKKNSGPFLLRGDEVPFSAAFKKGDFVPGYVLWRPKGSRGDVSAAGKHSEEDFLWTLELGRKLVTEDKKDDVQFADKTQPYFFGLAVWDNDDTSGHFRVKKPIKLIIK